MAPPYLDEERERRRRGLNIQQSLQKETKSRNLVDDMDDSDDADIDFTQEMHPIGHFIDDREKMIEEMFSILKGEKLQRILPAILKDYTMEELKADCLVHLLGMSKKRIFAILEGRDLNSSSDSETDDEPAATEQQRVRSKNNSPEIQVSITSRKTIPSKVELHRSRKRKLSANDKKKPNESDSAFIVISDDEMVDVKPLREERKTIFKLRKERRALKAKIEKKMKKTEKRKMKEDEIQVIVDSNDEPEVGKSEDSDNDDDKGKSLLEILELEMRARAIRALLKNTPNSEEPVPVSILNIKPEPHSKVETEINKTIAEVINEESAAATTPRDLSSPTDDIEISEVCDILTVTIDDDDDDDNVESTPTPIPTNGEQEVVGSSAEKKDDDVTWSKRWMASKGKEEVMKNNKLCANIRKRMRFARMLKEKRSQGRDKEEKSNLDAQEEEILSSLNTVEESSVAQYELIKSLDKLKSSEGEPTVSSVQDESSICRDEESAFTRLTTVQDESNCTNEKEVAPTSSTMQNEPLRCRNEESATIDSVAEFDDTCNDVPTVENVTNTNDK